MQVHKFNIYTTRKFGGLLCSKPPNFVKPATSQMSTLLMTPFVSHVGAYKNYRNIFL